MSRDRDSLRHQLADAGQRMSEVRATHDAPHQKMMQSSGAMGSRFREQLTHWTDPAVFTQPDQWKGFLSAMVTAHEADLLNMRNFLEEITKNKCNLTLKDLKPHTLPSLTNTYILQ